MPDTLLPDILESGLRVVSKTGTRATIVRTGQRDTTYDTTLYRLRYSTTGQVGNQYWTRDELHEAGVTLDAQH